MTAPRFVTAFRAKQLAKLFRSAAAPAFFSAYAGGHIGPLGRAHLAVFRTKDGRCFAIVWRHDRSVFEYDVWQCIAGGRFLSSTRPAQAAADAVKLLASVYPAAEW